MAAGGYREGSGRSKSGYYKGVYCGSTYELCWVIHALDHGIIFSRFSGKLQKDGVTYIPDFLLGDGKTIIETKGYEPQESVDRKTRVAESHGYVVRVLRKDDLHYAFEHVERVYSTKQYHTLYDDYKPKYAYICDCCKKEYKTDKVIKTETKFCSRRCAGIYRSTKTVKTDKTKKKISASMTGKKMPPYKRQHKQIWITDGFTITRIKEADPIPDGFVRGKTFKEAGFDSTLSQPNNGS